MDKAEIGQLRTAIAEYTNKGQPEKAVTLQRALATGSDYDRALLLPETAGVRADKPLKKIEDLAPPPNRSGKGSGLSEWRKWAKKYTDIEPAVINTYSKTELIEVLETRGNIPAPTSESEDA